jgi:hypothetical protein
MLTVVGRNHLLEHVEQVLPVGASGIHGGKFNVAAMLFGPLHHGHRHLHHLLPVLAELVHLVDLRRGQEDVNPRRLGVLDRFPRAVYVVGDRPGQGADYRPADFSGDVANRLEVPRAASGKSGLDDVDL